MAASAAAASNESNERAGRPRESCVWSTKETGPNCAVRTAAAAADWTEWPDVYSGNGGATGGNGLPQWGSIVARVWVIGRRTLRSYMTTHQAENASAPA